MPDRPPVSVIVNTIDRARSLELLLDGLAQLTYPCFEVVVVVGPTSDDTHEVLARRDGQLKVLECPVANLSMSRNIGVRASSADLVAFIDDDAVPEPTWLDELVEPFLAPGGEEVAAVGGLVYDHTGHGFQCTFTGADRLGNARPKHPRPLTELCTPGAWRFPYAPGGNALYRKELLVAAGGFDEEFEYYLEETDLCLRLIDRGWVIHQVDGGAIHHKFLPSGVRTPDRVLRDRFAVVKNKIYFSLVNAAEDRTMSEILADDIDFCEIHRADARWHLEHGNASPEDTESSLASIERAWHAGLAAGLRGRVALGFPDGHVAEVAPPFVEFPTIAVPPHRLRLCFVSQTIPPKVIGGIGRYFVELARELARRGHEVHVVTSGEDHDTVDLEDGVWVHRVLKSGHPHAEGLPEVSGRIADNAAAVAAEVERIHRRHPVDAVYAAMWDVEHLDVMRGGGIPVVTALVTTFAITLRTRPEWAADEEFMSSFGRPLLEAERWVLANSDGLHAISRAVRDDVEATSGVELGGTRLAVAPIGEADHIGEPPDRSGRTGCRILFVGRFEKRKGIDLLFGALGELLVSVPDAEVTLIGRNDLPGESGRPYLDELVERHGADPWFERVHVRGEVDDDELWQAYRDCDVLVAPSRFESFGLIYAEGMMAGVPVVAVDAGAAREVVVDGVTGILVEPTSDALCTALVDVARDPSRSAELGAAGRRRYEENFTVAAMADRALALFERVAAAPSRPGVHADASHVG